MNLEFGLFNIHKSLLSHPILQVHTGEFEPSILAQPGETALPQTQPFKRTKTQCSSTSSRDGPRGLVFLSLFLVITAPASHSTRSTFWTAFINLSQ